MSKLALPNRLRLRRSLGLGAIPGATGGGGGGYVQKWVRVPDLLTYFYAAGLSGSPVSSATLSVWIYVRSADAANVPYLIRGDGTGDAGGIQGEVGFSFSNDIGFSVGDTDGSNSIWWDSDNGAISYDTKHHVFASADVSGADPVVYLLVDGVDVNNPANGGVNGSLPFQIAFNGGFGIPAPTGNELISYADFWLGYGQFLTPADLSKFRDPATGLPVNLGAHGELPTGTSPTIFGSGDKDTFLQPNLGTGGALVLTGALANGP